MLLQIIAFAYIALGFGLVIYVAVENYQLKSKRRLYECDKHD